MDFHFNGDLLSDEYADILRWYGYTGIVCPQDIRNVCRDAAGEEITLYINSDGGSLVAGTEIYSVLREYPGNVTAHIQSRAASAATVAIMACNRIVAEPVALVCVHNPSTYGRGDADAFRHTAEELDNIKSVILNAYAGRAKISRDEVSALMDRNIWINADQAAEYGLVDEVLTSAASSGTPSGNIMNAAGRVLIPTEKMIEEYRAAKESEKIQAMRAKAWIDTHRN